MLATATDLREKRVPNWLTFGLMAVGLILQAALGQGVMFGLAGVGMAFGIHFLLWQIKLEGAGDAKLMMGVGALIGWQEMLDATMWRYVLNIPFAVIAITVLGKWPNFQLAARWTMDKAMGKDVGERPEPTHLPFAPLILVSVIVALSTDLLDFWS